MPEPCDMYKKIEFNFAEFAGEMDEKYPYHCCTPESCCKGVECGKDCCITLPEYCKCAKSNVEMNEVDTAKFDKLYNAMDIHYQKCKICKRMNKA